MSTTPTSAPDSDPNTPTTTTTIVLSGSKDDEPPPIGTTIAMPEGEQHQVFIGDPDDEAVREGFLGDRATIIGYGPMARDDDGNWTVSVEVAVGSAPATEPETEAEAETDAEAGSQPGPEAEAEAEEETEVEPEPETAAETQADGEAQPAAVPEPEPDPQPEPEPEPEAADAEPEVADAAELAKALVDDLKGQLDTAATSDGGQVSVDVALIERLARLPVVTDKIEAVRLEKGRVVLVRPPDAAGRRPAPVKIYPRVVDGKLDLDLWTTIMGIPAPVLDEVLVALVPDLPELIEQAKSAVNGAIEAKGLKVTDAPITPEGITIVVEKRDD